MKISTSLSLARLALGVSNLEAAKALYELGFGGIDFSFDDQNKTRFLAGECDEHILNIADIIHKAGLEISQCHLHYQPGHEVLGDGSYEAYEQVYLPAFIHSFELCEKIGCKVAVIHLYFDDNPDTTFECNIKLIRKMIPYLEKHGVTLAIENIFGGGEEYKDCFVSDANAIMRYINEINHPLVGACLDTGHANIMKQNPVEMVRTYGKHLVATHINTNAGRDMHLIPSIMAKWLDPVDYEELAKAMKEVGYKGTYNLEIGYGRWPSDPKIGKPFLQLVYAVANYFSNL